MGGQGNFKRPRGSKIDVKHSPDLVTPKLPALRAYQHSLAGAARRPRRASTPPAAQRGKVTFNRTCASCHVGGNGTDNNSGKLHPAGRDGHGRALTPCAPRTRRIRTTPLRGLAQHPPYFHDGSAKTLGDVVEHYNKERSLELTKDQQADLVEYLKTL